MSPARSSFARLGARSAGQTKTGYSTAGLDHLQHLGPLGALAALAIEHGQDVSGGSLQIATLGCFARQSVVATGLSFKLSPLPFPG